MCGIVGLAGLDDQPLARRMCDTILHRGPDDEGVAHFPDARMTVGMRRLSIIDIEGGHQPFQTPDGRVSLVFNGEIYNHVELRAELERHGHRFLTVSDTEVILNAYLQWGREAWPRLIGMFAVALVDRRGILPRMVVARDPFGIKPLYYHHGRGRLLFASEFKALLCWNELPRSIRPEAIWDYLILRYVPGPQSMFESVKKLPPGHDMVFENGTLAISRWWSPPPATAAEPDMDRAEAMALYGNALRASVRRHMISDVPLGAYLSGGVDSTAIAALMAENSSNPIHTFSVGFPGFSGSELAQAEATARHLGANHQSIECHHSDLKDLPDIVWALDEPFGDAIVLPMFVLARAARQKVKVVLSGEGADETLGGYLFQRKLVQLEKMRRWVPDAAWRLGGAGLRGVPARLLDRFFDYPGSLGLLGRDKLARFLGDIAGHDVRDLSRRLVTVFDPPDIRALAAASFLREDHRDRVSAEDGDTLPNATPLQQLIDFQFRDWLPDEILMKYDKMTMAHSLEGRVPFIDQHVVEAAARVPDHLKLTSGGNKRVLRDFARTLLPTFLLDRPKAAFYVPLESYATSGEFIEIQRAVLDPERLRRRGLFDPAHVRALFEAPREHGFLSLKRGFAIVMLELWFEKFCPDASWA